MSDGEESAFVADVDAGEGDKTFDAVEKMGRGAAKVREMCGLWGARINDFSKGGGRARCRQTIGSGEKVEIA